MKLSKSLTDETILAALGARLARRRIDLQLTQADLAEQAGVGKRTVERMEAGEAAQTTTLVRVMRVLDLLANLDQAVPDSGPRPLELLQRKGKVRQRASARGRDQPGGGGAWSWDEDT